MRIEIQIGNDEPKIYPLKETKLVIGSGDVANIQLPSTEGVSRKHLQITTEGDQFFVTDLGSANGTFMNEERLVPGTKTEFTSFFPVRIADNILISLLGDDEPIPEGSSLQEVLSPKENSTLSSAPSEKTQLISRSSLKNEKKTSTTAKKVSSKGAPQKKAKKSTINWTYLSAALLISGAVAYQFFLKERPAPPVETAEVKTPPPAPVTPVEVETKAPEVLLPQSLEVSEIPETKKFELNLNDIKCATNLERELCALIPKANEPENGVIESIDKLVIILPENEWFIKTIESFPVENIPPSLLLTPEDRSTFLFIHLLNMIPDYDWKKIEKNLFFALYFSHSGNKYLSTIVGMKSQNMPLLLPEIKKNIAEISIQKRGKGLIPKFRDYFQIIQGTVIKVENKN